MPSDEKAFGPRDRGDTHATVMREVRILDWLSAACQVIRMESVDEAEQLEQREQTVAWYRQNSAETLFPSFAEHRPPGPAAFMGEIVLTQSHALPLLLARDQRSHDALRFVLAHELVHAFESLPFIVPAFVDWDTYWEVGLASGCDSDEACFLKSRHAVTLDDYGGAGELRAIKRYWPSSAKVWFDAFRRGLPRKARERKRR